MTAIIIGRFQVRELHVGHLHIIAEAMKESMSNTVIFLGCTTKKDDRNPYSFKQRKDMIKKVFPGITIIPLWDNPSDEVWSQMVDEMALGYSIYGGPTLFYSRDSFVSHYKGKIPLQEVKEIHGFSGTLTRQQHKN